MSKKMFLRAEKGIAWCIDASSTVWTLLFNSKSANQIVWSVAIEVKKKVWMAEHKNLKV